MPKRRLIGVLGGMGPLATVNFVRKVIELTPASNDQDHVPMIIHSVPQIPDRTLAICSNTDAPFADLLKGLRKLATCDVDLVVMPCNTAHAWFDRLAACVDVKMLHIADAVHRHGSTTSEVMAIMATDGTLKANIYQRALSSRYAALVLPSSAIQSQIVSAIAAVKAGDIIAARFNAHTAAEALVAQGVDHLLLACTELSIAMSGSPLESRCVDATTCLALAAVAFSLDGS